MKILALDIGGTDVKYGYFGKDTEVFGKFSVIGSDGTESLPQNILKFINNFDVEHIGICAPGPFDFETGTSLMEHKLKSLYKISLRDIIKAEHPDTKITFIHDSTAFALGAICNNPKLKNEDFSTIMLGTGLGYAHAPYGKIEVNELERTKNPLWNIPYKEGIAEDYVSATAIISRAKQLGYEFNNVLDISTASKNGDTILKNLFYDVGKDMGMIVNARQCEDRFAKLVIGGQVSLSWDLFKDGFENVCYISYYVSDTPATYAVMGVKYCVENGKENIYKR